MRNPGYMRAQQVWEHECDVLFDNQDFGPNLFYRQLKFTPAKNRKQRQVVAGMPGYLDYSGQPAGYPVPELIKGTLELWVRDPAAWGQPGPPDGSSPEARFLAAIGNRRCRLDAYSFNGFYLLCDFEVTTYARFELGFKIVLKFEAEPYFWEGQMTAVEWDLGQTGSVNLFNPQTATLDTSLLPAGETCEWDELGGAGKYLLHASPDSYAEVHVTGLNAAKRYGYGVRNIYSRGIWQIYDGNGVRLWGYAVTGVTEIVFRLISKADKVMAVGFTDMCVYEIGSNVASGELRTLDAPLRTIYVTSSGPARMIIDGETVSLPAGEDVPVYGLNVPPRTVVPVTIASDVASFGYLRYRRGARSCTI